MIRLSDNPPILTPDVGSITELTGTWWLAHTKARFEKVFAWDMLSHGIGYFLPMRQKVIFSGGRKRKLMVPLFTSYVFICGDREDCYKAMATNRLCQTIDVADQDHLLKELTHIEKALASQIVVDQYPQLPIGSRCRVKSGPMMGIEGVVVKRMDGKARMVLEVSMLGQGALIEVDADLLEVTES